MGYHSRSCQTRDLDWIFGKAYDNAVEEKQTGRIIEGNNVEEDLFRVGLKPEEIIVKFETNYPEFCELSRWYQFTQDLKRLENKKREKKRDVARLDSLLKSLKVKAPDLAFDWPALGAQFQAIPVEHKQLNIHGEPIVFQGVVGLDWSFTLGDENSDRWELRGDQEAQELYKDYATRGATALGYGEGAEALKAWYILLTRELLKRDSPHLRIINVGSDMVGAAIEKLCEASAEYCQKLETETYTMSRQLSPMTDEQSQALEKLKISAQDLRILRSKLTLDSTRAATKPRPCGHLCGHEERQAVRTRLND